MSKVTAQTGHRPLQMTDAVHDLFELAFNALLAGLKSFQMLKEQVFGYGVDLCRPGIKRPAGL